MALVPEAILEKLDVQTTWACAGMRHGRFFVDIYVILNYVTTPINLVHVRAC